jgi:hypothetical protein
MPEKKGLKQALFRLSGPVFRFECRFEIPGARQIPGPGTGATNQANDPELPSTWSVASIGMGLLTLK